MAKGLPPLWFTQMLDNSGAVLAGGKVYSYSAGTTTPLATYTDSVGGTANANPVILDSAGRANIWLTEDTAYKLVVKTSADVTLFTVDQITSRGAATSTALDYELKISYVGTPGNSGFMGGDKIIRSLTFPANFSGAAGRVRTNPGATYAIDVKKNGSTVGTISIATNGAFTFSTSGGSSVSCVNGDYIELFGPASAGTAADFMITLEAAVA